MDTTTMEEIRTKLTDTYETVSVEHYRGHDTTDGGRCYCSCILVYAGTKHPETGGPTNNGSSCDCPRMRRVRSPDGRLSANCEQAPCRKTSDLFQGLTCIRSSRTSKERKINATDEKLHGPGPYASGNA